MQLAKDGSLQKKGIKLNDFHKPTEVFLSILYCVFQEPLSSDKDMFTFYNQPQAPGKLNTKAYFAEMVSLL